MREGRAVHVLSALASEPRLKVLFALMRAGERGARPSQLLGEIGGAQNTLSSNLSVLRLAGLVTAWREGRSVYYRADAGLMLELTDFLTSGHLDAGVEASSAEPLKRAI